MATQAAIAEEVQAATASKTVEEEPEPTVTLRPKADVELDFPIAVSVVGAEDDLVFSGPSDTVAVKPEVAEQITYSPAVEVAE